MSKSSTVQGMLYPEILDKQEYQVTLGHNKPSINRKQGTAVTISDSHCDCSLITHSELQEFFKPYNDLYNRVQKRTEDNRKQISEYQIPKVDDSTPQVNHARVIRTHVMYKEMFPLPKFQGTRDIQKEYLERAYAMHRWYRAEYNLANKETRKEHDERMKERKADGQWTWNYASKGNVPRVVNSKEYICYDIILQSVHGWLQYENLPIQQVGHLLSISMYGDTKNFLTYLDALIECLAEARDKGNETTDEFIELHFKIKRRILEKPLTARWTDSEVEVLYKLMHNSDVKYSIGVLRQPLHCLDVIEHLHTGISGLEYAEILRRLINLRQVVDVVHRYQWRVIPYNTVVPRGLAKYNKYVKKLAALYQSLCEGSFDEYGKLVPKTIQNMDGDDAFIPKHYQADNIMTQIDNAVEQLTSKDIDIQVSAGKHRWANTTFINGTLTKDLAGALRVRRNRPSDVGAVPKYINRWVTDKHVFARKRQSLKGGTVAIDCSGSMHFSADDIEEVITLLPASTIVGYAGCSEEYAREKGIPEGIIETFAKNQRTIDNYKGTYIYRNNYGENFVDVPAILWLASQPKPRMLVSDMEVVAYNLSSSNSYVYGDELKDYCEELCRKHDIVILRDINEAIEFAKTIRKR